MSKHPHVGMPGRAETFKPDRLLDPEVTAKQSEIAYACAPLDRAKKLADQHWGCDGLAGFVSTTTAAKYGLCVGHLNEAINDLDLPGVEKWVGACIRGLRIMHKEAITAGHKPIKALFTECHVEAIDGMAACRVGILHDPDHLEAARVARPDMEFITPRVAAIAHRMQMRSPLLAEVKKAFPKSTIVDFKPERTGIDDFEDEIDL